MEREKWGKRMNQGRLFLKSSVFKFGVKELWIDGKVRFGMSS